MSRSGIFIKENKENDILGKITSYIQGKRWILHVPVQENDPDIVISTGLVEGVRILEELLKYMEE